MEQKTTLTYKGRTVEMKEKNTAEAMKIVGTEPVQQEFILEFKRQYSDIKLKEAVRGVKVITKELIRFGFDAEAVEGIMDLIAKGNPIIIAAADAIDEAIPDD